MYIKVGTRPAVTGEVNLSRQNFKICRSFILIYKTEGQDSVQFFSFEVFTVEVFKLFSFPVAVLVGFHVRGNYSISQFYIHYNGSMLIEDGSIFLSLKLD